LFAGVTEKAVRRIDLTDAGFLYLESRETPMHVSGLNLFTFPARVNRERFMARLGEAYRSAREFRQPFGEFATEGKLGPLGPLYWQKDADLDMEYHVRHSALPQPGRFRELFALVSRLHSSLLDRSRPLWEVHLIEGLQNDQFAIYTKMHHATIDGVAGLRLTEGMCSTSPRARLGFSPFSLEAYEKFRAEHQESRAGRITPSHNELKSVAEVFREQLELSGHLVGYLRGHAETWLGRGAGLAVPYRHVPRTSLNARISGARRFVAQSWELDRVKSVGKALGLTVNDTVLAMCSGALRRYLLTHHELPTHSLRAMVPVSVRRSDDFASANSVSFITANLGTRHADPAERVKAIAASTRAGKALLKGLSPREAMLYAALSQLPTLLASLLGVADRLPAFSTTISNVPGPRQRLYWNGARLEGMYPGSAVFHGFALNITLVGYYRNLDFGITACRRSVPQVQRLIDYLEDSLVELEELAGTG
jgi:diacylglycerol O-acyltransferase